MGVTAASQSYPNEHGSLCSPGHSEPASSLWFIGYLQVFLDRQDRRKQGGRGRHPPTTLWYKAARETPVFRLERGLSTKLDWRSSKWVSAKAAMLP